MNNRKARKFTVCLGCAILMACTVTRCAEGSTGTEEQREEVIRIEDSKAAGEQQNEKGQREQKDDSAESEKAEGTNDEQGKNAQDAGGGAVSAQKDDETELDGDIISIGENSMVVSKIFTYAVDGNEEAGIAVSVEDGDAELITVYFSENTEFIVRTVKNGGVNGEADVEDRAGTSADLQERKTALMTGSYEGEDFHAEQVIIYNFI